MRYLAGYVGCAIIFVLLMGMIFKALVLPPIFARKKRFVNTNQEAFYLPPKHESATTITPAHILPSNFKNYVGNGKHLPMLMLDQEEHALVADVYSLPSEMTDSKGSVPTNPSRYEYFESIISGDSGNPSFLVCGDDVILLHTFHTGNAGAGPFLSTFATDIQRIMDQLSSKHNRAMESLNYFDFSRYPKLVQEVK